MAKKNTPPEEDIFDLTELIEEGNATARSGAAAYARQASAQPAADNGFEDLLAQAASGDSIAPSTNERPVNPDEELDLSGLNDIDNILESLDIPPQPARPSIQAAKKPEPELQSDTDDLDSVLDDLLGAPPKKPVPAAADAVPDDLNADLDNIMSSFEEPDLPRKPESAQKTSKTAPQTATASDDLDNILSSFDEEEAPVEKQAAPKKTPAPQQTTDTLDLDADLDEILGASPAPKAAGDAEPVQPKAPPAPAASADDLDLPDNLDELLSNPAASAPEKEPVEKSNNEIAHVQEPELPRSTATVLANPQEDIMGICQNLLSSHLGSFQDAIQKLSLETGSQTAHLDDLGRTVADISKRLFATESKLSAARSKLAALEKTVASTASLEDIFKEGSPLNAGFMKLLANSVGHAVQGVMESMQVSGGQQAQFQALAHAQEDVDGRMVQLETRMDQLEPALSARMEVVETTAARIAGQFESGQTTGNDAKLAELVNRLGELENSMQARISEHVDSLQKQLDDLAPQLIARLDEAEVKTAETAAQIQAEMAKSDNSAVLAQLSRRMDDLESSVSTRMKELEKAGTSDTDDAESMKSKLAAIEQRLGEIVSAFNDKITEVENSATAKEAQIQSAMAKIDNSEIIGQLSQKIEALEKSLGSRVNELEKTAARLADVDNSTQNDDRLASLEQRLEDLAANFDARIMETDAKAEEKITQLQEKLANADTSHTIEQLSLKIDELENNFSVRIGETEKIAETKSTNNAKKAEEELSRLQDRLDKQGTELEARLSEYEAKTNAVADQLQTELAKNAASDALAELTRRIDNLEISLSSRIDLAEKTATDAASAMEAEAARETGARLETMQKQMDNLSFLADRLETAEARVAELTARLEAFAEKGADQENQIQGRLAQSEEFTNDVNRRLSHLSSAEQSVNARVDSLEIRLDKLEPNFNIQIEKAAASTVARILNEEIRKLAGNR